MPVNTNVCHRINKHKINEIKQLYWCTLDDANNINHALNKNLMDVKFAFYDVNCTLLYTYFNVYNYYVADDNHLYKDHNGILMQCIYDNYVQMWTT